jgi:hypothetical protein
MGLFNHKKADNEGFLEIPEQVATPEVARPLPPKRALLNGAPFQYRKGDDFWDDLFTAGLGRSRANQLALGELLGEGHWQIDFNHGMLTLGGNEYRFQFLGSESDSSDTWLWGWENINGFDEGLLALAEKAKAIGEEYGADVLTTAEFDLDDWLNGHNIAMTVCGLADDYLCYYRCPYDGGAAFVVLSGLPDSIFTPVDWPKFNEVVMDCINAFDLNHRLFIEGFLWQNHTPYESEGQDALIAHFSQDFRFTFDDQGRLSEIKSV